LRRPILTSCFSNIIVYLASYFSSLKTAFVMTPSMHFMRHDCYLCGRCRITSKLSLLGRPSRQPASPERTTRTQRKHKAFRTINLFYETQGFFSDKPLLTGYGLRGKFVISYSELLYFIIRCMIVNACLFVLTFF
jgi:hypothetical protein